VVTRKSAVQIQHMRRAGSVVAEMHEACSRVAVPGTRTADLDAAAREVLERRGARSNFLGYHGFPAVACISVNEVVVHGIPGDRVLAEGDIVSIDCGAIVDGWHADAATTIGVGEIDDESQRLIAVTRDALAAGIAECRPDATLGDIGAAISGVAAAARFSLLEDYTGHGIGTAMHEDPAVPNVGRRGKGMRLKPGHVLALEPMVVVGRGTSRTLADGWTVVSADGTRSAHFEHTVAVTDDGPRILTLP
jgi:methionyl aminopeptidase